MIFLDRIVTTPLDARVREAMRPWLEECWGHPSSPGAFGDAPAEALETARREVAMLIGAPDAEDVFFTSGGTEALNWALKGLLAHPRARGRHIVISSIEALALRQGAERLAKSGVELTWLPVDGQGLADPAEVRKALRRDTALAAVTAASAEIGTLAPLAEIGALCREAGVPFLVDATQAAGWVPLNVEAMCIDLLALSAHYFLGPKGTGALYRGGGTPLAPFLDGGAQEMGLRPGTPNVAGIAGLGEAARLARLEMMQRTARLDALAALIRRELEKTGGIRFTGASSSRLPGHVSACFAEMDGEALLLHLNRAGVAAASGSACASEIGKPSYVLRAMGLPMELIKGSVVFAPQLPTAEEEVRAAMAEVRKAVKILREQSGGKA